MSVGKLKPEIAPFPYFGGKSRAAELIWSRLGIVENYVEPFAGSSAVFLAAPNPPKITTLNDADGLLVNFWRAVCAEPEAVAHHLDWPVSEVDLFARHVWLVNRRLDLTRRLEADPDWYDAKAAGWWCWGACAWIGSGWCAGDGPWTIRDGKLHNLRTEGNAGQGVNRKLPHLGNAGRGVNRQLPHLGDAGRGVNRQLPHLGNAGRGVNRQLPHLGNAGRGTLEAISEHLRDYMSALAARLRTARITCGDFERVLSPIVTTRHGMTGVLLDPPYDASDHDRSMYADYDHTASARARKWCAENGSNPLLRIALCGYAGEHDELLALGWTSEGWTARKGYQTVDDEGEHNGGRETIWFSPHCVPDKVQGLFGDLK